MLCFAICSCKKFLNEKSQKEQFIPSTFKDFQAILDNQVMYNSDPGMLHVLSDDYYITTTSWQRLSQDLALNYISSPDAVPYDKSWNSPYMNPIYYSNVVLDHLLDSALPIDDIHNQIKGTALFYRANSFFNIAQVFTKPYDQITLSELGIVLRSTSDINVPSKRASIEETYNKIVLDLKESAELLPIHTELQTRPTKTAAYSILARVYLIMRKYDEALHYAELALQTHNALLDFNTLVAGVPIQSFNPEVIFHSTTDFPPSLLSISIAKIDPNLLGSYDTNDLRRSIYFRPNTGANVGTFGFRGSFSGSIQSPGSGFSGTTTGEMLLIRAECYARIGNKAKAIDDLNLLLAKRMNKNNWSPIDFTSVDDPLALVLSERRKELVFRGLRYMDLKRLNMEGANITLKRTINGIEYALPPNDNRWVGLIPYDVISRSGIQQNLR